MKAFVLVLQDVWVSPGHSCTTAQRAHPPSHISGTSCDIPGGSMLKSSSRLRDCGERSLGCDASSWAIAPCGTSLPACLLSSPFRSRLDHTGAVQFSVQVAASLTSYLRDLLRSGLCDSFSPSFCKIFAAAPSSLSINSTLTSPSR